MNCDSIQRGLLFVLLAYLQPLLKADSIPEIVAKAKPAIVEIVTTDAKGTPKTLGTGFFVSPDGLLATNRHVIEGAGAITAVTNNGAIFLFERIVAQPPGVDLAILKFHATDVPFLKLGESTRAVEGQKVIVIGNPTGLMGTVSDGIISAFRENRSLIQITAPISPGSSGSPVMDETGQVIGVATLQSVEGQNLNFAIPVEQVSAALMRPPSEQVAGSALPTPTPTPSIDAKVHYDSGLADLDKKEYDKAMSDFDEAIRLDPNYALPYVGRGDIHSNYLDRTKAIADYTEAIRLDPNYAPAYVRRGDLFFGTDSDRAMTDYEMAIRLDPNYSPAYVSRGDQYLWLGKFDEAITDYTEAIRLKPDDGDAYQGRGSAYRYKKDYDNAIADYTEAIRLKPDPSIAYGYRGDAYVKQGEFDKATSNYNEFIRRYPNSSGAYLGRADFNYKYGDLDKAITDYTEAIRLDPTDAEAYSKRGVAYSRRGDLDKAKADFETANRLKTTH